MFAGWRYTMTVAMSIDQKRDTVQRQRAEWSFRRLLLTDSVVLGIPWAIWEFYDLSHKNWSSPFFGTKAVTDAIALSVFSGIMFALLFTIIWRVLMSFSKKYLMRDR